MIAAALAVLLLGADEDAPKRWQVFGGGGVGVAIIDSFPGTPVARSTSDLLGSLEIGATFAPLRYVRAVATFSGSKKSYERITLTEGWLRWAAGIDGTLPFGDATLFLGANLGASTVFTRAVFSSRPGDSSVQWYTIVTAGARVGVDVNVSQSVFVGGQGAGLLALSGALRLFVAEIGLRAGVRF